MWLRAVYYVHTQSDCGSCSGCGLWRRRHVGIYETGRPADRFRGLQFPVFLPAVKVKPYYRLAGFGLCSYSRYVFVVDFITGSWLVTSTHATMSIHPYLSTLETGNLTFKTDINHHLISRPNKPTSPQTLKHQSATISALSCPIPKVCPSKSGC